ncbi:MAG TPA: phospholipase D-like domain-containing protein [Kofleriaceae bacterium]|jgi:phosphatidylserine/phosphatidylglycerophosphate/cardiolipin synthase-like enzyme|nr:phospholipase D-like domain-containing protein [Kofleriaceae bacterium]
MAQADFQVVGTNDKALFTLKLHRGEGMVLLAMNWKQGKPTSDFVGFAIEYQEPGETKFWPLRNRLTFSCVDAAKDPNVKQTLRSPIQKFRWVHLPMNAAAEGKFTYRVTPVFMSPTHELSYGEPQKAEIALARETYPKKLDVTFTRGYVTSQAFVDHYESAGPISTLLPAKAADGLRFVATHPKVTEALPWMGFEARKAIFEVLDAAVADDRAAVRVVAYDLNEPELVAKLEKLGARLQVVIDDSDDHAPESSAETQAATRLRKAGAKVVRQSMGNLQHNKMIVVDGKVKKVVCGSTNFSWRGFYVQSNNAVVLTGPKPVKVFAEAFDVYFSDGTVKGFGASPATEWTSLGLSGLDAQVTFSPHANHNAALASIADDIAKHTTSSLLYSLAFLYQTPGPIREAVTKQTNSSNVFVYGISDKKVGLDLQMPNGNVAPVYAAQLAGDGVPEPFKSEPTGGGGTRMHHKFVVIDFDKPTARVYLGSYNFSSVADTKNGENLLLIKDRRIATSYMIEALRIFDHYHFRVIETAAKGKKLSLKCPPQKPGEKAWFEEDWSNPRKKRDRELFA